MEERIFFNQGNVSVSNSRFIVKGQTYVMSNVTSVKSGIIEADRSGSVLLGIIGLLCFLGSGSFIIFGLIFLSFAFISWVGSKVKYSVILNTSAGENKALVSENKTYITNVISALNEAIVSRG